MDFRLTNTNGLGNMFAISGPSTHGANVQQPTYNRDAPDDTFEAIITEGEAEEGATYHFEDSEGRKRLLEIIAITQVQEGDKLLTRIRGRYLPL